MDKEKEYISIIAKEVEKELLPKFPNQNDIVQNVLKEVDSLIEKKLIKVPFAGEDKKIGLASWLKKAMNEGTGSAGGYLVPQEYINQIWDIAKDNSFVLKRADIIPMSTLTDYATNLSSGVNFSWVTEGTQPASETEPAFGQVTLTAKKALAITTISNELLEDQKIGPVVDAYLASLFGREMGKEIDRIALVGNTTSGDPFNGILNTSGTNIVRSAGATEIDYDSMIDCTFALSDDYALEPVWIGHRLFYAKAMKVKDSAGSYILSPETKTLLGYEMLRSERMPSTFTADSPVAIFGDLKNVKIGLRQDLQVETSKEVKFLSDQIVLRAKFRVAITIWSPSGFVVYKTATA